MQTEQSHAVQVHLSPASLESATRLAEQQGLSIGNLLDQTLAEVLTIKEQLFTKYAVSEEDTRELLAILDTPRGDPMPGDELPEGYERIKY